MGLVSELRRRNVFRMAALYLVSAWLVLQVVDVLGAILVWPLWTGQVALAILAVGFPIALIISWFYEVTPAGVRREEEEPTAATAASPHGRAVDFVIISVLCAAVLVFAYDKWWPQESVERAIVVRPFENLSGDPEQDYFSDGIADDTRNLLADIRSFKVIAWATARMFEGADIAMIASELNVSHVLDGTVRRSGDRVRVTVELIDSGDSSVVWSEPFERELTAENLFEIQHEIAKAIVARLRASLTEEERERLERMPTQSTAAYEAYLRGKQGIARGTTASLAEAAGHLKQAIELDPMYAEAHAALARAYWMYLEIADKEMPGVADEDYEKLIERALELDPHSGLAHAMHARWTRYRGAPREQVEAAMQKAIELSPNDPDVYLMYGNYAQGRERSLNLYRQGLEVDPKSSSLNVYAGYMLFELGRPDESVYHLKRAIEADPDSGGGYEILTFVNWYFTGRMDEAMRQARTAYAKDPEYNDGICWIGWTYLFLNDDVAAERWFRHAMSLSPNSRFGELGMIDVYHVRGLHDQEWQLLEKNPPFAWDRATRHLVNDQRYEEARDRLMSEFPDVFAKNPENTSEYASAAGVAFGNRLTINVLAARILTGLGETEHAARLLSAAENYVANRIRSDPWEYTAYAELYAALGRSDDAITALRRAIDGGAYGFWPLELGESKFDSIRNDPEFQQLRKEIEAKMAIQLERVREMERNGELAMLPEAS
jgi:TolB-like protein